MKHPLILFIIFIVLHAQQNMLTFPDISPDGKSVVFTYSADLWLASIDGGLATRLTELKGVERHAKFSPDGKKLVFSSNYQSAFHLRLMDLENNGNSTRLTHFWASGEFPDSWSADSKHVYFTSDRRGSTHTYTVNTKTKKVDIIFPYHFRKVNNIQELPSGNFLFSEFEHSKNYVLNAELRNGYRGSGNADIKLYDKKTEQITSLTKYNGNDLNHRADQNGNIYFISDRANRTYNIYKRSPNGNIQKLTDYNHINIKRFNVTPDGSKLIFERDYQIYLLDLKTLEPPKTLNFKFYKHNFFSEQHYKKLTEIDQFDISDTHTLLISHGRAFLQERKTEAIQELPYLPASKVEDGCIVNSNLLLLIIRSEGVPQIYSYQLSTKKLHPLTSEKEGFLGLYLNHKKDKVYSYLGDKKLIQLDLKSKVQRTLIEAQFNYLALKPVSISPNDRYITTTAYPDVSEREIYLYDSKNGTSRNLTKSRYSEYSPTFFNNDSLYMISDQTQTSYLNDEEKMLHTLTLDGEFHKEESTTVYEQIAYVNGTLFGKSKEGKLVYNQKIQNDISISTLNMKSDGKSFYYLSKNKVYKVTIDKKEVCTATEQSYKYTFTSLLSEDLSSNFLEISHILKYFSRRDLDLSKEFDFIINHNKNKLKYMQSRQDFTDLIYDVASYTNLSHQFISSYNDWNRSDLFLYSFRPNFFYDSNNVITHVFDNGKKEKDIHVGDKILKVENFELASGFPLDSLLQFSENMKSQNFIFQRGKKSYKKQVFTSGYYKYSNEIKESVIQGKRKTPDDIAYLLLDATSEKDFQKFSTFINTEYFRNEKIIIDLRYNYGGNRHEKIINLMTNNHPYVSFKTNSSNYMNERIETKKRVVVLVNEETCSDGEVLALGFKQFKNVTLIGTTTQGYTTFKDNIYTLNNTSFSLPYWSTHNNEKQNLEMRGVEPDILVPQELSLDGSDKQLEAAIRYLNETEVVRNKND